jgi:hypothetical protein
VSARSRRAVIVGNAAWIVGAVVLAPWLIPYWAQYLLSTSAVVSGVMLGLALAEPVRDES